jgi:hypothetical protein
MQPQKQMTCVRVRPLGVGLPRGSFLRWVSTSNVDFFNSLTFLSFVAIIG